MSSNSQENRTLRKHRTMRYFIKAAREIIAAEGVEAVSIRNVSAKAGYSSGSLYDYFESIDQLIGFVAIDSINDFLGEITTHVSDNTDPLDYYLILWHFFSAYAFENPALYEKIVVLYGSNVVSFWNSYSQMVLQESGEFPTFVWRSFFDPNRRERDEGLLYRCAEKGYFKKEDIALLSQLINAGFLGCLKYRAAGTEGFGADVFINLVRMVMIGFNPALRDKLFNMAFPDAKVSSR